MSFYGDLKSVSSRLLKDKGQKVTFSTVVVNDLDPTTGGIQSSTSTYNAYGLAFNYKASSIDGAIIQNNDIRFLMDAKNKPIIGDTTTIDNINYKVIDVKATNPSNIAVMYEVQLRS